MWKQAGLVLASVVLCSESASAASTAQNIAAIKAELAGVTKSYVMRNAAGAMAPYVSDSSLVVFDLMPPIEHTGYAGNLRTTQDLIDATTGPIAVDYSNINILVDHDHAYGWYFVHVAATMKDASKIDLMERTSDVFKKIDGKWRIVFEHNSVPIDMVNGVADLHSDRAPDRFIFKKK